MLQKISKFILILLIIFSVKLPVFAEATSEDPIDTLLENVYKAWNKHDIEKLFSYYSNSFLTGDGINKEQYKDLTKLLWENYPNVQIESQRRTVRSQDQYATISSIDLFFGDTKKQDDKEDSVGSLSALAQGQLFLKKYGETWKIESERTHFELVTVYYGNAKEYLDNHQIYFSAPEQVNSGDQYSATLYFILPDDVTATATINKELITSPQEEVKESYQNINAHKLERLFNANEENYNELVSATIVLSKGIIEPKFEGILFISKRVNIIPQRKSRSDLKVADYKFGEEKEIDEEQTDTEEDSEDSEE